MSYWLKALVYEFAEWLSVQSLCTCKDVLYSGEKMNHNWTGINKNKK